MSLETIKEYLSYEPATGVFTWIKSPNARAPVSSVAGTMNAGGYRSIRFDSKRYYAHRLAWWFVHGVFPPEIDHRNRRRDDNRINNLRSARHGLNIANAGRRKKTGYKGVCWNKRKLKWQAKIKVDYHSYHLGYFNTEEDGARAYDAAAGRHFGEFACLNFS